MQKTSIQDSAMFFLFLVGIAGVVFGWYRKDKTTHWLSVHCRTDTVLFASNILLDEC